MRFSAADSTPHTKTCLILLYSIDVKLLHYLVNSCQNKFGLFDQFTWQKKVRAVHRPKKSKKSAPNPVFYIINMKKIPPPHPYLNLHDYWILDIFPTYMLLKLHTY